MSGKIIIIPAYNEEESITGVIEGCRKYAPEACIVVINDGSGDRTASVASKTGAFVISHPYNMGVGAALQTGYRYAYMKEFDYLVQLDADGQHKPEYLTDIFRELESGDAGFVIGSRFLNGSRMKGGVLRSVGNIFFARLISFFIREKLSDPTSGMRGMNRGVLGFCVSENYRFDYPDADFLLTLHKTGFRFKEVPVKIEKRKYGVSQHKGLKPVYYFIKMMLSIFIILLRGKKQHKYREGLSLIVLTLL